jgi:ferrous iron transport protein B
MWERGWSFIKKAGTVILISSILIWFGSVFGNTEAGFGFDPDMELESSVLGIIGGAIQWIFAPIGFGNIKATIATIMGLVAKEEVVGVFGVLDFEGLNALAGFSFLIFNLLCAPCFAAIGAIKREMNSAKWTWFAIGYQCVFAYAISLIVYQFGLLFTGAVNVVGLICAVAVLAVLCFLVFRPAKKYTGAIKADVKVS